MLQYLTFNTGTEMICFLVALFCLPGNIKQVWPVLIPYLLIICMTEFAGIYLKRLHHPNQWPYNILLIVQIVINSLMFMYLFNQYIKSKMVIIIGVLILFVLYAYEIINHGFLLFNTITYNTMSVIFIMYCFYYFYLLLNDDAYIKLKYSANFWWVSGALFFYFGSTAVNIFRGRLSPIIIGEHNLAYYIYILLNIMLYGLWSYSFICKNAQQH